MRKIAIYNGNSPCQSATQSKGEELTFDQGLDLEERVSIAPSPKLSVLIIATLLVIIPLGQSQEHLLIGKELGLPNHMSDGDELATTPVQLIDHGRRVFQANWTIQEGGGRPLTKGSGAPLADLNDPLVFPRNFNRVSAPDANSCLGCHNAPSSGGAGDIVANVFVLGQRFDFATFGGEDNIPTKSSVDENGNSVALQTIANSRATLGMFGAGYIEMLARQITEDLQLIRDSLEPGESQELNTRGISFGILARSSDGIWDVSRVEGLPSPSLKTDGPDSPPNLIIRPFHQAGAVISLRQFSNNAFNHHHGIQSTERFGKDTDPDNDGYNNELSRADVTAVSIYQATLPVPGRLIPNNPIIEAAILAGEAKFQQVGCTDCHLPSLPLRNGGWNFTEPNPFNPSGNLQLGEAPTVSIDLNSDILPGPRLPAPVDGELHVPAFTDLKLHDITSGPKDPNRESLNMHHPGGSSGFTAGNSYFLTRKLWDLHNKPNYFHHGQFTTIREAILAHNGEAQASRERYEALSNSDKDSLIEFLKTLQVLPPGTTSMFVDENFQPKSWPPARFTRMSRNGQNLTLHWAGSTGLYQAKRSYQIQKTTGLATGRTWEIVGETNGEQFLVTPKDPKREFYRILVIE